MRLGDPALFNTDVLGEEGVRLANWYGFAIIVSPMPELLRFTANGVTFDLGFINLGTTKGAFILQVKEITIASYPMQAPYSMERLTGFLVFICRLDKTLSGAIANAFFSKIIPLRTERFISISSFCPRRSDTDIYQPVKGMPGFEVARQVEEQVSSFTFMPKEGSD